MGFSKKQILHL